MKTPITFFTETFLKVKMMSLLGQFLSEMQQDERLCILTLTTDCRWPLLLRLVPTVSPWNLVTSATAGVMNTVGSFDWQQWCRKRVKDTTISTVDESSNKQQNSCHLSRRTTCPRSCPSRSTSTRRTTPLHDQVDPMDTRSSRHIDAPTSTPQPYEEWTWRPASEVLAPEPNSDVQDEPMGEPQEPPRRRVTHKRPPTADEQGEQHKRAR